MGKYFDGTCIYLDQFAVSNISDETAQPIWNDILLTLIEGVLAHKFAVPYSIEHLIETSGRERTKAEYADKLLYSLSRGLMLDSEPITTSRLVFGLAKDIEVDVNAYCSVGKKSGSANTEEMERYADLKKSFNNMAAEATGFLNEMREATRAKPSSLDAKRVQEAISATALRYQKELIHTLQQYRDTGEYDKRVVSFSFVEIPFWTDTIMSYLIASDLFHAEDANRVIEILTQKGVKEVVPTIYVRTALETMMALKRQKEIANDHIDILRLATAIPFCDVLITDKAKCYDIRTAGLDKQYSIDVYSSSPADVERFHMRLKEALLF